ncbi:hypothetical protein [Pantoea ananatis]|uniref:hypothetical protein n=1 Tax=Pantoea ananas TaxID=553 RepID=UPI001B30295B|nr:hypothetical protein [Pantoea ananatis]
MKARVELSCAAYPLDKMWIDVTLNDKQFIDVSEDIFGAGVITYAGDARDYHFHLYENAEAVAGIDWKDKESPAGELHILGKRVVKGANFQFVDSRERCSYSVTNVIPFS